MGYKAGLDVISLSLGGADGWTESASSTVASAIAKTGVIVTISAGNSVRAHIPRCRNRTWSHRMFREILVRGLLQVLEMVSMSFPLQALTSTCTKLAQFFHCTNDCIQHRYCSSKCNCRRC